MQQRTGRHVAVMAGVLMAGAALAACGGGSSSQRVAQGGAPGTSGAPTTTAAPSTTAPATTLPGPAVTGPTAASTTVAAGEGRSRPLLVVPASNGTVGYRGREPSTIGFSRDSTNIVSHLTWNSWGPATAVGRGLLGVNNCEPNCATGTVTQVLTTIDLGKVVAGHFTAITENSGSLVHRYSYPSDWVLTAS